MQEKNETNTNTDPNPTTNPNPKPTIDNAAKRKKQNKVPRSDGFQVAENPVPVPAV